MKQVTKKLSELKRPEKNVRMHTDKQLAEFRRSVEMFGQIRPIVCDENGVILAGNGLYETLLSMGRADAECYVAVGLSEKEKKKLMLADNRIFDLGVDDMKAFDELIAELGDDLDVPGFDDDLLRSLVADVSEVDEIMSSYGTVTEEQKASIVRAGERMDASTEESDAPAPAPQTVQYDSPAKDINVPSSDAQPESRPFIVCPKCGEKIWL